MDKKKEFVETLPMKDKGVVSKLPITTTVDRIDVSTSKKITQREQDYYSRLLRSRAEFNELTNKELEFVVNYNLFNGSSLRAYEATFPKDTRNIGEKARKLMERTDILNAINAFWKTLYADKIQRIEKGFIDTLYRRAFTNPFKYFNLDGTLKDGITEEDIGDDFVIIDGVEKKVYTNNRTGEMKEVVVYKLADRDKAFDKLQKVLGLDVTKISIIGDLNVKEQTSGVLRIPTEITEAEWEEANSK